MTVVAVDRADEWGLTVSGPAFAAVRQALQRLDAVVAQDFPQDTLQLVTYAAYAEPIERTELAQLSPQAGALGTNLHAACVLAQPLLTAQPDTARHLLILALGEPTAHLDDRGREMFAYPPSPITRHGTQEAIRTLPDADVAVSVILVSERAWDYLFLADLEKIAGVRVVQCAPQAVTDELVAAYRRQRVP